MDCIHLGVQIFCFVLAGLVFHRPCYCRFRPHGLLDGLLDPRVKLIALPGFDLRVPVLVLDAEERASRAW